MQHAGCCSGHYYSGDSIIAASGSLGPQFNIMAFSRDDRGYNNLPQPPYTDQCLSYDKALLRGVMLKHEAIFQYQIRELHHLYEKQRQLMGELQMKSMHTNGSVSQLQCDVSWTSLGHIPDGPLSNFTDVESRTRGLGNIPKPSTFIQMGSEVLFTAGNDCKELEASSSRENKFRKRSPDLKLPAALFMNSDEGERSEENRESVLHDPSRNNFDSSNKKYMASSDGIYTMMNLRGQRLNCVFDLNEPLLVNESTNSTSSIYSNMSHKEIVEQDHDYDPSGSSRLKSSVLNEVVRMIPEQKGEQGISFASGHQVSFFRQLPLTYNDGVGLRLETARYAEDIGDFNRHRVSTSPVTDSSSLGPFSSDIRTPVINRYSKTATGGTGFKTECLSPNLDAACSPSLENATFDVYCSIEDQSTNECHSISSNFRRLDSTKSVVDLNLNVMPSYSFPEIEVSPEKINFSDGMANFDLNVVPSSSLSETEVFQEKAESINCNSSHDSSLVQSSEIGDKPDNDYKMVVHPVSLESLSSRSPLSAHTLISSPSSSFEDEDIQNHEQAKMPDEVVPCISTHESEKCDKDDSYLGSQSGKENSGAETCMPLPFTFREELLQTQADANGVETGIQAPHGPEKEPSPPREGSEENMSNLEESKEGLDRIAAETIISMSLSEKQPFHKNCRTGHLDASIDCLDWFAGIISSATGYMENKCEDTHSDAPVADYNPRILNSVGQFEAKTIKSIQTSKIINVLALPCQRHGKKTRAKNAGEQKKTQAVVAPKNITVDTRKATEIVKGRRNVNEASQAQGERRSSKSFQKVASKRKCKVSKQQQHTDESEQQGFVQSWLFEWGRKKRRQNGGLYLSVG